MNTKALQKDFSRTRKKMRARQTYFGEPQNSTKISSKHFKNFGQRIVEENWAQLEEGRLEQQKIKENRISKLNWENLSEGRCPKCNIKLIATSERKYYKCPDVKCRFLHNKRFVISAKKLTLKYKYTSKTD